MMVRIVSQTAAAVADSALARDRVCDRRAVALAGLPNLSHRHVDVRQEGHDPRSDALGETSLEQKPQTKAASPN